MQMCLATPHPILIEQYQYKTERERETDRVRLASDRSILPLHVTHVHSSLYHSVLHITRLATVYCCCCSSCCCILCCYCHWNLTLTGKLMGKQIEQRLPVENTLNICVTILEWNTAKTSLYLYNSWDSWASFHKYQIPHWIISNLLHLYSLCAKQTKDFNCHEKTVCRYSQSNPAATPAHFNCRFYCNYLCIYHGAASSRWARLVILGKLWIYLPAKSTLKNWQLTQRQLLLLFSSHLAPPHPLPTRLLPIHLRYLSW